MKQVYINGRYENIIKIGTVELPESEVEKLYNEKMYICSYSGIYQIFYSLNAGFYGHKVIDYKGYASKGRFYTQTAETINYAFGKKILVED